MRVRVYVGCRGWVTVQAHSVSKCFALYVGSISSSSQGSKNVLKEFFVSYYERYNYVHLQYIPYVEYSLYPAAKCVSPLPLPTRSPPTWQLRP